MARKFILDTDWFTDCDDCVALRFLIRSLDEEHRLLGVNVNATTEHSYASIKAFMEKEGRGYPIALEEPYYSSPYLFYQEEMARGSVYTNADGEKSLDFYKRILEQNDEVEILSIGFLTSIATVFQTYPELIKKVRRLWIMGGKWDEQGGEEYNFTCEGDEKVIQATRFVVNELDIPKTFLGVEIGCDVFTGGKLSKEDTLGKAVQSYLESSAKIRKEEGQILPDDFCSRGRESWDPMLVLAAFYDKYEKAFAYEKGFASVDENAKSYFKLDKNGRDRYALKIHSSAYYQEIIDEIIKE